MSKHDINSTDLPEVTMEKDGDRLKKSWDTPSVQHSDTSVFQTTPDQIDPDTHIVGTFFITCDPRMTIDHAGVVKNVPTMCVSGSI